MQYGFYFDAERCIGCSACVIACQDWNESPLEDLVYWRQVTTTESGKCPNVHLSNQSRSCLHCGKPACQRVCPSGAISKRPKDGIVVVDRTKCIGCRKCLEACPFKVPQYGADGKMQKCNLCLDKVSQGKQPACAAACTGSALHAGPLDKLARMAVSKPIVMMAGPTRPSLLVPKGR